MLAVVLVLRPWSARDTWNCFYFYVLELLRFPMEFILEFYEEPCPWGLVGGGLKKESYEQRPTERKLNHTRGEEEGGLASPLRGRERAGGAASTTHTHHMASSPSSNLHYTPIFPIYTLWGKVKYLKISIR